MSFVRHSCRGLTQQLLLHCCIEDSVNLSVPSAVGADVRFVYKLRVNDEELVSLCANLVNVLPTTARPRPPPASHLVDVYTAIMAETLQGSITNNPIPKRLRRIAREIEKNYNTLSTFMKMKQTQAKGGNWQTSSWGWWCRYDARNVS